MNLHISLIPTARAEMANFGAFLVTFGLRRGPRRFEVQAGPSKNNASDAAVRARDPDRHIWLHRHTLRSSRSTYPRAAPGTAQKMRPQVSIVRHQRLASRQGNPFLSTVESGLWAITEAPPESALFLSTPQREEP
jgi:hypothetical protein